MDTTVADAPTAGARASSEFPPGTRVDRYVLLRRIGLGGMGAVYAAYDQELDRKVALKFVRPRVLAGASADESLARLSLEARAMARVSHPNVVTLYQVGPAPSGGIYLAMELVEGGTLEQWIARKGLGWREILRLLCEAGDGLAAAHAAGMIHRDFKLENVLVREDGRPQVTDFGIVRSRDARSLESSQPRLPLDPASAPDVASLLEASQCAGSLSNPTATGAFLGTPGYMAPEQFTGESDIDVRADVFAFAATCYRALFRERPFPGRTLGEIAEATLQGRHQRPPAGTPVPRWVQRAVMWGLATDREQRPGSMAELLAALRADPRARRRRWIVAGLVALLAGAALAGARAVDARRESMCRATAQGASREWDAPQRAAVDRAFAATGRAYAAESARRAAERLDRYVSEWSDGAYEACAATTIRRQQSSAALASRLSCLDTRRDELRGLVAAFESADGKTVENAVEAAASLSPPAVCARSSGSSATLPDAAPARAEIRDLQGRVAAADQLRSAGREVQAAEQLRELETRVKATAYGPLLASYTASVARAKYGRDAKACADTWAEAIGLADSYGLERDRAVAEIEMGRADDALGAHAEARRWYGIAHGTMKRLESEPRLELNLDAAEGLNLFQQGENGAAARKLENALERAAPSRIDDPRAIAYAHSFLAFALSNDERELSRAVSHARAAVTLAESAFGPEHPIVSAMLTNLTTIAITAGQPEEALATGTRAVEALRAAVARGELAAPAATLGAALQTLGNVERVLGRNADARAAIAEARAIDRAAGRTDYVMAADNDLANVALDAAQTADAKTFIKEARALASGDSDPELLADIGVTEARLALAEGRVTEALPMAERASAECEKSGDVGERATGHLVVGRALLALRVDAARARRELESARDGFERMRDARSLAETRDAIARLP